MSDEPAGQSADEASPGGLSARLRALMAARGIPPEWLALISGVPAPVVVPWHRGEAAIDVDDFARLARAVGGRPRGSSRGPGRSERSDRDD